MIHILLNQAMQVNFKVLVVQCTKNEYMNLRAPVLTLCPHRFNFLVVFDQVLRFQL